MNEGALFLMLLLGAGGAGFASIPAFEYGWKLWHKVAIGAWLLVWCGPPLLHLWIKGVAG